MNDEQRQAIRQANFRRGNCGKCGAGGLKMLDGSKVGGLAGILYKVCDGCGWSRAMTKREHFGGAKS